MTEDQSGKRLGWEVVGKDLGDLGPSVPRDPRGVG
jgi:hypothetical protein